MEIETACWFSLQKNLFLLNTQTLECAYDMYTLLFIKFVCCPSHYKANLDSLQYYTWQWNVHRYKRMIDLIVYDEIYKNNISTECKDHFDSFMTGFWGKIVMERKERHELMQNESRKIVGKAYLLYENVLKGGLVSQENWVWERAVKTV